jgi:hypothetical protein
VQWELSTSLIIFTPGHLYVLLRIEVSRVRNFPRLRNPANVLRQICPSHTWAWALVCRRSWASTAARALDPCNRPGSRKDRASSTAHVHLGKD